MKIDHIALFCRDLEAMRQFAGYQATSGPHTTGDGYYEGRRPLHHRSRKRGSKRHPF